MRTINYKIVYCLLSMLFAFSLSNAQGDEQEKTKLQIGDQAPPLKYAKWIQGPEPILEIDNNKIYVIEFWATWCGPCIQAMPHLSELATKYKGKIDFIGVDVWENTYGGPKDQESYLKKVSGFVKDQNKMRRLTYNVIMDNTAEDMGSRWLKDAGIGGIPSSFVIDKGKIAWIGHPHYIDSILVAVLDGSYDALKEKQRRIDQAKKNTERSAGYRAAINEYKVAKEGKDYGKALRLMDSAIARFPAYNYMFTTDKFMLLLDYFGEEKAIDYGRDLQKEKLPGQVLIANLFKEDKLPKKVYEFAIETLKNWNANAKTLDIQALLEARIGRFKDAAVTQRKAVEKAKAEKDNPAMTETVIEELEKKAKDYEKKARGN
jgi:thiol-disulfide isomerase/thioredoxin